MSIPEGMRLAAKAFNAFYTDAKGFDWAQSLPLLQGEVKKRVLAKAGSNPHGRIYTFPRCASGIGYGVQNQEIAAWEMSILLAEYAAGLIALKAAEGHCTTNAPCKESSAEHLEMLEDVRTALAGLVAEVDDYIAKIKALPSLGEGVARSLGLRD
jgi:hypothetical protein